MLGYGFAPAKLPFSHLTQGDTACSGGLLAHSNLAVATPNRLRESFGLVNIPGSQMSHVHRGWLFLEAPRGSSDLRAAVRRTARHTYDT